MFHYLSWAVAYEGRNLDEDEGRVYYINSDVQTDFFSCGYICRWSLLGSILLGLYYCIPDANQKRAWVLLSMPNTLCGLTFKGRTKSKAVGKGWQWGELTASSEAIPTIIPNWITERCPFVQNRTAYWAWQTIYVLQLFQRILKLFGHIYNQGNTIGHFQTGAKMHPGRMATQNEPGMGHSHLLFPVMLMQCNYCT